MSRSLQERLLIRLASSRPVGPFSRREISELKVLECAGYVTLKVEPRESGRPRVSAKITDAGLDVLAELNEFWHRAAGGS